MCVVGSRSKLTSKSFSDVKANIYEGDSLLTARHSHQSSGTQILWSVVEHSPKKQQAHLKRSQAANGLGIVNSAP